jgi:hypothetical protein
VREIAAMLPAGPSGVGRPITDRAAWGPLARLPRYQQMVREAERLAAAQVPPQPDELYKEFARSGNRATWEAVAFGRRRALGVLVMAECLEDRGRFLAKVQEYASAICAERTWVWSAHDPKLANFNGESVDVDLGAAELGWHLATARWLLAQRLPPDVAAAIVRNVERRVVAPFVAAATGQAKPMGWATRTNNWNPVCHAGVVGATLATIDDRDIRALAIVAAERDVQRFLDGFGPDGYCGEGLGYWNYGFGHYALLAESVREATGGRVDFMAKPAVRQIAAFGSRIQVINGISPAFADSDVDAQPAPQVSRYAAGVFRLGMAAKKPSARDVRSERFYLYEEALYASLDPARLAAPAPATADAGSNPAAAAAAGSPLRTWFDHAGVLIARPAPTSQCRIGVALKGGDNAEPHNHNDLGSYVVVRGDRPVLLDPGRENYTARTFGKRRYEGRLLNSFGHGVPIVAGQLQRGGAAAAAKVLRTEFTDATDTVVLDLTSAYAVPELKRLERTFRYERQGTGSFTVTDQAEFTTPQTFATAMITLGKVALPAGDTPGAVIVTDGEQRLRIDVDTGGAASHVGAEVIREDAPVTPTRIAIELRQPTTAATVTLRISAP